MADLQMSLNKWVAGIVSVLVIILHGIQESNVLNLERQTGKFDAQKLNQIVGILSKMQPPQSAPAPSPSPSSSPTQ
jgi:hypothetical protein